MINKLKKQEEEINELMEIWKEYQNAPKHYNVPLPEELKYEYSDFYRRMERDNKEDSKLELNYLKEILKIYEENDFIVTEQYHMGNFNDTKEIKMVQITPEIRENIKNMCSEYKKAIERRSRGGWL